MVFLNGRLASVWLLPAGEKNNAKEPSRKFRSALSWVNSTRPCVKCSSRYPVPATILPHFHTQSVADNAGWMRKLTEVNEETSALARLASSHKLHREVSEHRPQHEKERIEISYRRQLPVYIFFPPVTVLVTLGDFLKVQQIQPNVGPDAVKDLTAMFIKSRGPALFPGSAVPTLS